MAGEIRFNFEPGQVDEAIAYEQAKVVGPALDEIEQLNAVVVPSLLKFIFRDATPNIKAAIATTKINTASKANSIERGIKANRQASHALRPYFHQSVGQTAEQAVESLHAPLDKAGERVAFGIKGLFKNVYDSPPRARQDETEIILLDTSEPGWKPSPGVIVQVIEGLGFDDAQDQFVANRQESEDGEISTHATIFPEQWMPAAGSDGRGAYAAQAFRPLTVNYTEVGPDIRISIIASTQGGPDELPPPSPLGL